MTPIVTTPHSVLTTPSFLVTSFDKKLKSIIADLKETLVSADNPKGVGLAAPQVGKSLKIFLLHTNDSDLVRVFINPKIIWQSKSIVEGIPGKNSRVEGCLSIPKVWGIVKRHRSIKLAFQDELGNKKQEKFIGFAAIIVQHEVDHLDGILFPRRVLEQKGALYKAAKNAEGKEILEPFEI